MSKINILCTGSSGFIFSNFIRYMRNNFPEYHISSIDAIKDIRATNSIFYNKGHQLYMGDITDSHFVNNVFELVRPDIVIHGAAESFVDKSLIAGQEFVKSNVLGTQVLIDASIKYKINKFIYFSTDEVYGALSNENDKSWTEESLIAPRNPYSATKACGELLVKAANITHGLNYIITRACNNYGPRQPRRNLIPITIANILEGKETPIYGTGLNLREWMFVEDTNSAIKIIMENGNINETYNISSNYEYSNLEVCNEICNLIGRGHQLLKLIIDPRPGHDFRYSVDSSKLKNLGWKPEFKFKGTDGGLFKTIQWYKLNNWFWK